MNKALAAAAALAIGTGAISLPVAHASPYPYCDKFFTNSVLNEHDMCVQDCANMGPTACQWTGDQGNTSQATTTTPAQAPITTSAPPVMPAHAPEPPPKAASVKPPKGMSARPEAVEAAKSNRSQADPAHPPRSPNVVDFNQRVQDVIHSHSRDIDVINGQAHPRHWDCTDHDQDGNPVLVNPTGEGTTFRYFYQGSYREAYVEAGSSVAFTGVSGVFPFTAVGGTYLASGSFYGGAPPDIYQGVTAYVPAYGQYVQVDQVEMLGHDDSQPVGSQDAFMLNDTTLARGQATNPSDGGQVTVSKTQTLPGVGPEDDGKSLLDLAVASHPDNTRRIAAVVLYGLAALGVGELPGCGNAVGRVGVAAAVRNEH